MEPQNEDCDVDGFENAIDKNFRCQICFNTLEDPVQCRTQQHYFCTWCLTQHLERSQTCPLCREELTLETLRPAPRIVANVLSQLKYHYENKGKGCCDETQLSKQTSVLRNHVSSCGFHPIVCSNKGCFMIINKRDRELHETLLCGAVKKSNCEDCGKGLDEFKECGCRLRNEIHRIKTDLKTINKKLGETVHELEMEKNKNYQLVCVQEKTNKEMCRLTNELKNYQVINNMKRAVVQVPYFNIKDDIIVAGGWQRNSVEVFSWATRTWQLLGPMKERRFGAASVVYESQMVVSGGLAEASSYANDLEAMEISQDDGEWFVLQAQLPFHCHGHKCVLYGSRMILIGGYIANSLEYSNNIYDLQLVPPYSCKLLSQIPQPRCHAAVECVCENKILILGGETTLYCEHEVDCVNSVLLYDINEDQWEEMAPLPFPVSSMATVQLQDDVILIGGSDKSGEALDTVVMYNAKTGKSNVLPSMKHKRAGCVAIITGNVIVVMGGYNSEQSYLNSVECFNFVRETWQELPSMVEQRYRATAVTKCAVIPSAD